MIKLRKNVPPPPPEPLSPQAVEALFKRIRAELGLPPAVASPGASWTAREHQESARWPRATEEDMRNI